MRATNWPAFSPFARAHYDQGFREGVAEGVAEGMASLIVKVLEKGEIDVAGRSVMLVLEARGFPIKRATFDRITACTDLPQLASWITRAATIQTIDDLFDETG
jgi:hypothetical protein